MTLLRAGASPLRIIPSLCASSAITVKASSSDKKAGGATETHPKLPLPSPWINSGATVPVSLPVLPAFSSVLQEVRIMKRSEERATAVQALALPFQRSGNVLSRSGFFNASFLFGYVGVL